MPLVLFAKRSSLDLDGVRLRFLQNVFNGIPSRGRAASAAASLHCVLVENRMNWRTVDGRGRLNGRRKAMKGVEDAIVMDFGL